MDIKYCPICKESCKLLDCIMWFDEKCTFAYHYISKVKEAIMDNPWVKVHDNKAECDIDVLNKLSIPNNDDFKLHFELFPVPYIGNKDAPILYLTYNPGFDEDDPKYNDGVLQKMNSLNLVHKLPVLYYLKASNAFFKYLKKSESLLNYLKEPDSPGTIWWNKVTKSLREDISIDIIAKNIFCIQYLPYHSVNFHELPEILKSQEYNFWLVEKAIINEAFIIVRSEKLLEMWCSHVKKLVMYQKKIVLNSPRTPDISPGNCSKYDEIVKILKGVK